MNSAIQTEYQPQMHTDGRRSGRPPLSFDALTSVATTGNWQQSTVHRSLPKGHWLPRSASASISVYQRFHFRSVRRAVAPSREIFRCLSPIRHPARFAHGAKLATVRSDKVPHQRPSAFISLFCRTAERFHFRSRPPSTRSRASLHRSSGPHRSPLTGHQRHGRDQAASSMPTMSTVLTA